MTKLHLDFETFSSVDLRKAGMYKYIESPDFEILLCAASVNDGNVFVLDLTKEGFTDFLLSLIQDPSVLKVAHNAAFERNALRAYGIETDPSEWYCTAVKSAYHGLPLSLGDVSEALKLGSHAKDPKGKALIKYFCTPCKPTKANGGRTRNLPHHAPEKWAEFIEYCRQDVVAEKRIEHLLSHTEIPAFERELYAVDQAINDKGVGIDLVLARNAVKADKYLKDIAKASAKQITHLDNPASPAQLRTWLSKELATEVKSLAKEAIPALEAMATPRASQVLSLWSDISKTSVKKYDAMLACACDDGNASGLFQFYGAMRTGRWAGRLIQLQNLKRNKTDYLDEARELLRAGQYEAFPLMYDDPADILSQLIRTALIPDPDHVWGVMDFSAIEARVLAWLAGERWRLEVFKTHGKIYEASASSMFNVPLEQVTKGSKLRDMGKVAELALGFEGGVGALKTMGGEDMGLSEEEMARIVKLWRLNSPSIQQFWKDLNYAAIACVKNRQTVRLKQAGLEFSYAHGAMRIKLPSGRLLMYHEACIKPNRFGGDSVHYKGVNDKKQWTWLDTYGGKLAENITQSVARDILAYKMVDLHKAGFDIRMHVHDEAVLNLRRFGAEERLERVEEIMSQPVPWAKTLPLAADGYLTNFYKKD